MAKLIGEYYVTIKSAEYRPCLVNGEDALFHKWATKDEAIFHFDDVEKISMNCGIVEYRDGTIKEVRPESIQFLDSEELFHETAGFEKEEVKDGECEEM